MRSIIKILKSSNKKEKEWFDVNPPKKGCKVVFKITTCYKEYTLPNTTVYKDLPCKIRGGT
jgi:hypothetical protein